MKMKNMLIGGMSLALVACISIGGTLAYLTDTSDKVTNIFYGSDGISMTLTEAPVEVDPATGGYVEKEGARQTSNTYDNILSNVPNAKDPTVNLETIPAGGVKVYAYISGVDKTVDQDGYTVAVDIDNRWKKAEEFDGVDGVYVYTNGTATTAETVTGTGDLVDIFQHVTFTFDQDEDDAPEFDNIEIEAFAIQAAATDSDALTAAKTAFGLNQ